MIPLMFLWPLTALAVVAQTFSTSSLTNVATTVMLSPSQHWLSLLRHSLLLHSQTW